MNWYYSEGTQQKGPINRETLETMARNGTLRPHQLVWTEEFGSEWKKAESVPGLFPPKTPSAEVSPPVEQAIQVPADEMPVYRAAGLDDGSFAENSELTRRARSDLQGNWGVGVGVTLLHIVITQAVSNLVPVIGPFLSFFLSAPLSLGLAIVFLHMARENGPEVGQLFAGFASFWNALGVYLLTFIFVVLWSLLLIIPGIIASISYSQVYYLLADHPNLEPIDAIRSSKVLMQGHKWQYFCLGFRLLGWVLLSLLTLGIGLLWVMPYMQTAYAEFYLELRKHQKQAGA